MPDTERSERNGPSRAPRSAQPLLAADCRVERTAPGAYERDVTRGWWAQSALHGGYVFAIAISAFTEELAGTGFSLNQLSLQFLRPFVDGPLRTEVAVEREGRRTANATIRMLSGGRLAGVGLASAVKRADLGSVALVQPPRVRPYDPAENTPENAPTLPVQERVWIQQRVPDSSDSEDEPDRSRLHAWVAPQAPEPIEHQWVAVLVDLMIPPVYEVWERAHATVTLDLTYHARMPLPRDDLPPGSPLLLSVTNRLSAGGVADEDVEVWSASGDLIAQSRQTRLVL